jgi:hypothetical protein
MLVLSERVDGRLLPDIIWNVFLLAVVFERLHKTFRATHTTTDASANVRGVEVLV